MELREQNILFFTRTMKLGGTENVILQLCEIFQPLVNKIVVCSCGGVNVEKLNSMGIKHYEIPDIENKKPTTILKVGINLKKIVRNEKITVIHTHHRMAAFFVTVLKVYKKCIFINTSHNTFFDKKGLTNFVYKNAHLIACGEMVKKNLVSVFDIPDQQIEVIHNAVKAFEGELINDDTIRQLHQESCFVVGNVGRLSEQKGMEYYLKAIPRIIKECPKARFLVIGNGEDEGKLKKLSEELAISRYVFFMGYRSDIQNLMSQMDLVVLSSLWEGLPLTPIEAFSVGKSIVATAVDGTVEIVKNEENGWLVEAKNPEQIAEKVIWMIKNPIELRKMEIAARDWYEKEFSFLNLARAYVNFYKELT